MIGAANRGGAAMLRLDLLRRSEGRMTDERLPEEARASRVIGSVVAGRYRVQRLLGRGGMGAVYEALDTTTSALVAVKVISEELAQS